MENKKRVPIHFFISYAHTDDELATIFIDEFKEMSGPSKRYEYIFWQDTEILPGENWKEEIQAALKNCDLGLLLISPAFLGSEFIVSDELPKFIGDKAKPVIPIMLKKVNFERHDLKGLKSAQIVRHKAKNKKDLKSFAQCGRNQKAEFVYELFDKVEARIDKLRCFI